MQEAELRQAWKKCETSREVAVELGCSKSTVLRWSRKYGIKMKKGPKATAMSRRSSVSRFMKSFEGTLPQTLSGIAKVSGCTVDAIRCYSFRLRKQSKNLVDSQPWRHNGPPVVWTDVGGVRVPDTAFDVVRAFLSRFGSIRFEVRLKTRSVHVFKLTASQFRRMYDS